MTKATTTEAREVVPIGLPALDLFLQGGLPAGYMVLLLAPPGSGAEMLAKQFAAGSHKGGSLYVTTDESIREIQETAAMAEWDFADVQILDLQTQFSDAVLDAQRVLRESERAKHSSPGRSLDPRRLMEDTAAEPLPFRRSSRTETAAARASDVDYLGRLLDPFNSDKPPKRLVIHSLDFFLNLYPTDQVISTLTAIKAANAKRGGLLLVVLATGAHGTQVERRFELLADCLIELEVNRKGTNFERFFLVRKVKNRSTGNGVSTYTITPHGFNLETLDRIV